MESWIPNLQFFKPRKGKPSKSSHLSGWGINVTFLRPHEPQLSAMCCVALNQIDPKIGIRSDLHPIFSGPLSTLLHPVLASSFPPRQDISKRANFPIVCVDWFYKKAVWSVVKSWGFEGNLSCSKMLRIWRKNSLKRVLSFSREYWVYFDITSKRPSEFEFWGEFGKSRDFFCEQI